MVNKKRLLKFREVNRDIFEAICGGTKKIETRAATIKFQNIKTGDKLVLVCGQDRKEKVVKTAEYIDDIATLVKKYKIKDINPFIKTVKNLEKMYYGFPGYKEKIKKYGLVAIRFK